MSKTFILVSLLFCAVLVVAQTYPGQNPSQNSTQTSSQASNTENKTTIQGCLSQANGSYTLTDNSGTTYQLAGDTSKLSDHVGHKVEITGTATQSEASSGASATSGSTKNAQPTLNVSAVKHIASSCGTNP